MNDTLLTAIISGVCLVAGATIPIIIQRFDKKKAEEAKNAQMHSAVSWPPLPISSTCTHWSMSTKKKSITPKGRGLLGNTCKP